MSSSLAFISYRRADTGAAVRCLAATLRDAFGSGAVFFDTDTIRTSDDWTQRIDEALRRASLLVAVIGPTWLRIADEFGRRRLDLAEDWVRNEIKFALDAKKRVLPLLFSGTAVPRREALPDCLAMLPNHEAFELRDKYWEQDVSALLARLADLGFTRVAGAVSYPTPHVWPKELESHELEQILRDELPSWRLTTSSIPGQEPRTRTELMRIFRFRSFEDAMTFMQRAVPYISDMNHHPRWENVFSSLTIWLTTWDIGFKPSRFDVELATHFDRLFKGYEESTQQEVQ